MKPTVSLIVLNYNGKHLLKAYFDSVFKQTLIPDEVIMLDNASTDDSVAFVIKKYPKVKIIINQTNEGTAGGSNAGFRHAKGQYVIFQSNDLELHKDCIKSLVHTMEQDKKIGICTSVYLRYKQYKKGTDIVDNAGGIVDYLGFGMQKYPDVPFADIPKSEEVFFAYGSSFIIPSDLYRDVGMFDERFFTLNDDIDLCWRVRRKGYKIIYTKESVVIHHGSATLGPLFERPIKWYWSERNALSTLLKNYETKYVLKYLPIYILLQTGEISYLLYKRKFSLLSASLKAIAWNIYQLPNTLSLRREIQKHKSNEKNTYGKMVKHSLKFAIFKNLYTNKVLDQAL